MGPQPDLTPVLSCSRWGAARFRRRGRRRSLHAGRHVVVGL